MLCDDIIELVGFEVEKEREKLKNLKNFKSNLKEGLNKYKRTYFNLYSYSYLKFSNNYMKDVKLFTINNYRVTKPIIMKNKDVINFECPVLCNQYYDFFETNEDLGIITQIDLLKANLKRFKYIKYSHGCYYDYYNKKEYIQIIKEHYLLYFKNSSSIKKRDIQKIFFKYLKLLESGEFDKVFNFVKSTSNKTVYVLMSDLDEYDIIINNKL